MSSAVGDSQMDTRNSALYAVWKEIADLENTRTSFFEDLFIQGYVVDSLEVPKSRNSEDLESFIEIELKDLPKLRNTDYGRVVFKTKNVYTGNFKDWKFHGPGRYVWNEGTVYQGEFVDGLMSGQGTIEWLDGCIYEGSFLNGVRCGWGVYILKDGFVYQGDWFDGLPHGKGRIWFNESDPDQDYYDGGWMQGLRNGTGTRQYSNGDRFHGNWLNGERSGEGTMVWLQDRQIYRGEWLNGLPHGNGKHIWFLDRSTRGSGAAFPTRHVYFGEWEDGLRNGIGKMIYPCGSTYEGRWVNGQREGKGIYLNPAGDMIMGLFKTGNLIGGSDVPLHAPTHEFDYGGLVEWLTSKFQLERSSEFVEEKQLADITLKYLSQMRQLYARAGKLAHCWGDNGLFPHWKKGNKFSGAAHMQGRTSKVHSPDGVHPVTRMGLWLLLKDVPGLTEFSTMSYFDKHFIETPTISFQTRHNPFEPVYLWQFLQCLVITSIALYVELPERDARINELTAQMKTQMPSAPPEVASHRSSNSEMTEMTEATDKIGSILENSSLMSEANPKAKKTNQNVAPPPTEALRRRSKKKGKVSISPPTSPKEDDKINIDDKTGIDEKKSIGDTDETTQVFQEAELEDESVVAVPVDDSMLKVPGKKKSLKIKKKNQKPIAPTTSVIGDLPNTLEKNRLSQLEDYLGETGQGDVMLEGECEGEDGEYITDCQIPSALINLDVKEEEWDEEAIEGGEDEGDWIPYWKRPRQIPMMTIYEAFEKFIRERLIPCLNRAAGDNLPQVPTPLPPLRDLWDSFKKLHEEREWIFAREFIQSIIPNKPLPPQENDEEVGEWESPEMDETSKTDVELLVDSTLPADEDSGGDKLSDIVSAEFLGSVSNVERMLIHKPLTNDEVVLEVDQCHSDEIIHQMRQESAADFLTEAIPFAEDDLIPSPFLWQDEPKLIHVPRSGAWENLEMADVTRILRNLYPKLLHDGSPEESGLNFEMVFLDWLLAVCECAKVSADRDLRLTVDPALRIWPSEEEEEEEEDEEYEIEIAEECYDNEEYCIEE